MQKRFIIASGGTGGHFYPGFALGKALRQRGNAVLFIVRKKDPAVEVLKSAHLKYREIDFMGLPRSVNPLQHLRFVGKLLKSIRQTRQIIRKFRPHAVLGTGGYISFPLIFTAHFMGIKTAVHDSNARLGLANQVCGKFADLFMLGLPINKKIKHAKLVSTPIRPEFAEPTDRTEILTKLQLDPNRRTALVVGGSQGAKHLNTAIAGLAQTAHAWQFIHITGEKWYQDVKQMHGDNPRVVVLPYSHEIYALMQVVDVAVCRSGASTIAELLYCQLPAIFVPFPHAAANHQYYNAKILEKAGAALIVPDDAHLTQTLPQAFNKLDKRKLSVMRYAYLRLRLPNPINAARNIARMLMKL